MFFVKIEVFSILYTQNPLILR